MDNITLIIAGSSTSWILGNIGRSKGGLYNRVTSEMKILPFTLKECEEYFASENIELSKACQLLQASQMSVADVAYSLGFESPTHFSRIFKQRYGSSPISFVEKGSTISPVH